MTMIVDHLHHKHKHYFRHNHLTKFLSLSLSLYALLDQLLDQLFGQYGWTCARLSLDCIIRIQSRLSFLVYSATNNTCTTSSLFGAVTNLKI